MILRALRLLFQLATEEKRHIIAPPTAAVQGYPAAVLLEGTVAPRNIADAAEGSFLGPVDVTALDGWTLVHLRAAHASSVETAARVLSVQAAARAWVLSHDVHGERWVMFRDGTQRKSGSSWAKLEKKLKLPERTLHGRLMTHPT